VRFLVTEVKVQEGESIEAALRRFKREVLKAGIILEIKKRRHHEDKRERKKRKKEEARRKNSFNSFNKRPQA
jgi:small subunit ribosomal protein S21